MAKAKEASAAETLASQIMPRLGCGVITAL
jgi:hypothetical protein